MCVAAMGITRILGSDAGLQHPLLFFSVLAMGVVFLDPFHLGPMGGHDYRPVRHDIAPYARVMARWPRDPRSRLRSAQREFAGQVFGPESLEFDLDGRGPYAGLADGRVVRWTGAATGWETFAVVTANWSESECANGVEATTAKQHGKEGLCGRPLGLRFDRRTGELYIADAYHGLMVVGRGGGVATPLATHAQGMPVRFANDLDVHGNGSVFFTDTSARYSRRDHFLILLEGEATGRLLRYDPSTRATHVVLSGLAFPNGVQISEDQSFLLFAETTNCRLMRYWLEGARAGEVEVFADLPGFPDNVRANGRGEYWVAIDCCRTPAEEVLSRNPWLRALYFRLPARLNSLARLVGMDMYTVVSRHGRQGEVLEVLEDTRGEVVKLVSEVREVSGKLWLGTVAHNHIATLAYHP
uniref:Adipocyte plasma membrane-associated protein n=1 Tax=Anthurium amnicola TaxID=1678845 RepID=A0A1D1YL81_9ARAE